MSLPHHAANHIHTHPCFKAYQAPQVKMELEIEKAKASKVM